MTERVLKDYMTPGNFDLLAATHAGANIGTSYLYETIKDARKEDTPAKTDVLYAWLFDETRAEGDYAKFVATETKNDKTETVGCYVVYFVEENEETWKMNARTSLANERLEEELEEAKKTYGLEVDTEEVTGTADEHEGHDHD